METGVVVCPREKGSPPGKAVSPVALGRSVVPKESLVSHLDEGSIGKPYRGCLEPVAVQEASATCKTSEAGSNADTTPFLWSAHAGTSCRLTRNACGFFAGSKWTCLPRMRTSPFGVQDPPLLISHFLKVLTTDSETVTS